MKLNIVEGGVNPQGQKNLSEGYKSQAEVIVQMD